MVKMRGWLGGSVFSEPGLLYEHPCDQSLGPNW